MRHMTNKQFQSLCEKELIPEIDKIVQRRLAELNETVEIVATETFKIKDRVNLLAAYLGERDIDADN